MKDRSKSNMKRMEVGILGWLKEGFKNFTPKRFIIASTHVEANDNAAQKERLQSDRFLRLLHGSMGLQTETAEVTDILKKHLFYGREIDLVNMKEELGDVFWYIAVICDELGLTFEEVMHTNSKKLMHRYSGGFSETKAENRDLDGEREILEEKPLKTISEIESAMDRDEEVTIKPSGEATSVPGGNVHPDLNCT